MEKITIENATYKWFEMKFSGYDKLEYKNSIYFYYDGDEYADIRIDKKDQYIYYRWKFYEEFCEIIPLNDIEFQEFMVKWVEDTFDMPVFTPRYVSTWKVFPLKIPKLKK